MKRCALSRAGTGAALLLCAVGMTVAAALPAVADEHNGQYTVKGPWVGSRDGDSTVHCEQGDQVVANGYEAKGGGGSADYMDGGPTSDGTGRWTAAHGGSTLKVRTYLLCQKPAK